MNLGTRRFWMCTLASALLCVACVGEYVPPQGGHGDDDDDVVEPETPDAAPPGSPDAAPPPPEPDAGPPPYPSGPYGNGKGDVIMNHCWTGYADSDADADHDPTNEPAREICLNDFFRGADPGSRILMITSAAGWCGACQQEAGHMPSMASDWQERGVRFLTTMLEDSAGNPSPVSFAKSWASYFDLTTPVVADPDDVMGDYALDNSIPMNLFVDTTTMTIVEVIHGYDPGYTEQVFETYAE